MSLEELLSVLSNNLVVRSTRCVTTPMGHTAYVYTYREVPKEVKEQFQTELRNHLSASSDSLEDYFFDHWDDEKAWKLQSMLNANNRARNFPRGATVPQKPLHLGANANLLKVFLKLPAIEYGDEYGFRCETFFRIIKQQPLRGGDAVVSENMSSWIKGATSQHPW